MAENHAIAVAGGGTTAAVVAACLASVGHRVVGVGASQTGSRTFETARVSSFEPGLTELLQDQQGTGRLVFDADVSKAVQDAEVTFLCVDGQSNGSGHPAADALVPAVRLIGEAAGSEHVIVVISEVPMGDGSRLGSMIDAALAGNGDRPSIVSHPGFMRVGRAVDDFLSPEHMVIGSDDPAAVDRVAELLRPIIDQTHAGGDPKRKPDVIRTDLDTAEGIKRAVGSADLRAAEHRPKPANRRVAPFGDSLVQSPAGNGNGTIAFRSNGERPDGNGAIPSVNGQRGSEANRTSSEVLPKWKRRYRHGSRTLHPTVSVVIPTLNEADNLPHVVSRLPESVDEVVIVDGRSTDGTVEVARRLIPGCVVVLEERPGKGVALRSGFEVATSDIVVMLDADGSTDPREIPVFVGMLVAGADFVKGSRFIQGGGTDDMERHRKFGNRILTMMVNIAFGGRYSDLCYGYNAMWRDALPAMDLDADGFEIETLMGIRALRAGLEIAEVPSFECPRIHGTSNLSAIRDGFRILRTIIRERLHPFRRSVTAPPEIDAGAVVDIRSPAGVPDVDLSRS